MTATAGSVQKPRDSARDAVAVIVPRQPGATARLVEVWRYRRLIRFFGRRALEKMYVRTKLGWLWVILRPLMDTMTRALIFGGLLGAPSLGDVPYFLFFLVGMGIWMLFDRTAMWSTRSIELNRKLVAKMYFPRIILPIACSLPGIVDFGIYIGLTAITTAIYAATRHHVYIVFGPKLLVSLGALIVIFLMAVGLALWTSVLGAAKRDVRFTLGYILGFWYVVTPVIYPIGAVPEKFRTLATVNPLASLVEAVRWGLFGAGQLNLAGVVYGCGVVLALWVGGLWFFGRAEAASIDQL